MAAPYTIEIYVPSGDPEGLRIVSLKNWTGIGLVFPRQSWTENKTRPEFRQTGVYILSGYGDQDPDMPILYIGQTDELRKRLDQHVAMKEFWDRCVVFVSSNNFLNRAHVTWLEWKLYQRATKIGQCKLNNAQAPQEPSLSEAEKADMQAFCDQLLSVLPLIGVNAFEEPRSISVANQNTSLKVDPESKPSPNKYDTIIVPANKEGFDQVFIGEDCWYAIRIGGGMLDKIKHIAGYQTTPVMAITHVAEIEGIVPYGDTGKYKVIFSEPAKEIEHIPYGDAPSGAMQGPRYTNLAKLKNAKKLTDVL